MARALIVVLLAWVLVPISAQSSSAFAGTVAASGYASRDILNGNTTTAQSVYPTTPSASASFNTMTSTANADDLADTAVATAKADGYSLLGLLSLATATANCNATATGVSGTAQAGGLTLLGLPVNTVPTGNIPPNTTVQLTNLINQNVGYITYNEQTITNSGGQFYISVTAAHIVSKTTAGVINGNLELAHVECGSTQPITPTVSSLSPSMGPETGGTSVVVTGTNFLAVSGVKVGTANATSYVVNTLTQITVTVPAGTGVKDILVTNVAGTNSSGTADDFTYIPKPTVTAINPTQGPTSGGTSVLITGTNLLTATGVKFGATAATSFTVNSNTSVTAVAPVRTAGTVDITVTAVGGTSDAVSVDEFTYVAPPTVSSVSPSSGPLTSGNSVTITGSGFTGASAVKFGSTNTVSYVVNSPTQITAVAPAGSVGTVDVTVTTVGGTSAISAADRYTYVAAPTVTGIAPTSGPTTAGTSVVITGTNLTGATAVRFGATAATGFTVNSATQITATAPAGSAGTVDVTVTTVGGTSATSSADQFTYIAVPAVTAVSPNRGPLAGGTTVVITGTNFSGASNVRFGVTNATSYVVNSATQITAVAPARPAGTVDVTVTTVGGTSATSSADQYTYVAAPTVTNVAPKGGPVAGGTSVTVTGTDFTGATAVTFDGVAGTALTVSNDTQLVVTAPAHSADTVDIVVTAPGGVSATSSADQFTYYSTPAVSAVSPSSGPTTAGTVVIITGTNLAGATAVRFGATAAVGFTVNSATQITATAPAGSVGTVDVTVTTPGGTSPTSSADQFTYIGVPAVSAVSPSRGPLGGSNTVVITGTGFSNASAVKFGSSNATSFTVNSATQITAVAPAGSLGTVDVTVTTIGGTSPTSSADQYSYVSAPTVTAISPTAGPIAGGTAVTITGTGFTGATAVSFGGSPATGVITVSSDTQITAVAPARSAGTVDVTVTAPGGVSATNASDRFTYVNPPAVTSLSPSSGSISGGVLATVTITGTDFTGASSVTFDNYPTLQILSVTPTQIQVRGVPPHATGPVHVQVTTPYGTSAATPADVYTYQGLPTLTSVSPSRGPVGGGGQVVLTGTGFTTASDVRFGANPASYTVNSDTQITATVPLGSAGTVNVTVTTLYGLTGGSNPVQYTYVAAPVVTSVSPVSGPVSGGTLVTLTGSQFTGATAVSFGGVAATGVTVSSDTQITAFTPAQAAGTVDVSVASVGGSASLVGAYTYVATPTVTSISPVSGPVTGGTSVTITGTGFSAASAVSFGGSASSFTVNSGTQITAVAPSGSAGPVDVRVTTVGGTSAVVVWDRYTYVAAPTVTAIAPQAGPLAGGNTVVVAGTGFTGASAVSFGGTAATSYTVDSATQITAVAPSGSAGTVDVRVTTVGGTSAAVAADRYSYQAAPSISGLSPTHGPIAGGTLVTITGSGFSGATAVTFDGVPAAGVIAVSNDGQIIAQAPAHVAGIVNVVVTAPGGVSAPSSYRYVGTPAVSGLSPVNGPIAGGTSVVITGTGFATVTGASAVQFGGTNAASYTVNSDTQITAVSPAHAAGPIAVSITTADGGTSTVTPSSTFTFIPVPTVTSISPTTGPEAGGTSVTINGTGFTTASSVRFGSTSTSFTVDSDSRITATAPVGSGLADVTVTTVGGTSALGERFRYVGTPTVSGLSPTSGPVAGGTAVTITGTQFYGVTAVSFGGTAAIFTVVSPTEITATAPARAAGAADVRVTTMDGGLSAAGQVFTYIADPAVTGLVPTSGPTGGGTVVVISGSGFSGATAVRFGSSPASSFTVNSGTQITAVSPAGSVGTVDVTVTGLFATSATTAADRFTYAAGPTVTSVSPSAGPLGGGNTVTVTGTGFTLTSGVTFGGAAATSVQWVSATQLTAVVPSASAGSVNVMVSTQYGQDTLTNGYRYRPAPAVTSISPTAGPEAGGTLVSINGSGFSAATSVAFGASMATGVTVSSDTLITVTAPAGTGTQGVTVTGPGGTSPAVNYRYAPVPVLSSVSPTFGPTAGGSLVTLTGSGFTGATNVVMDGASVGFAVVNDSTITLTSPGGAGQVPIVVITPGGSTAAAQFTYANAPTVSTLSPDRGPLGGGTSVTITGTGFTSGSTVDFGATPATSVQFVSDTELLAVAPVSATPASVNLTVTTPYGSASSTYQYVAAPTVTVVQPGAGPLAGGTVVAITGTGFSGATAVRFGPTAATAFTVNSSTSITATAPAHAAGTVDLTVTTAGGTSATSVADQFSYLAAPSVTAVQPGQGPLGGGTSVTITGSGFTPGSSVTFGGVPATGVAYVGPTELTAVSPTASNSGSVLVRVATAGGADSGLFTYRDAPVISQLQPPAGPEAGGTTVIITGSDFNGATEVRFGSNTGTFTVDSNTRITATAPAGTGTVGVRVTGPGGISPPASYRYAPVPASTSLTPTFGPTSGGTSVTLAGSGFTAATSVTVNGVSAPFTQSSDTTITLTTPPGTRGNAPVVVTTPGGSSAPITFLYANAPIVTSLTPDAGPLGGGTSVIITGTDFTPSSTVTFGGGPANSVQYVSPTEIRAESPLRVSAGAVSVVVSTPYGSSSGNPFTYTNAPTISTVSPTAGPTAGGTTVTISGSGLTGAASVTFDGVAATSYTVANDATITAITPAHAAGNAVVRVTTVGGSDAGNFRYANTPSISSISPTAGPEAGGNLVTITGSGFAGATTVAFGAATASSLTVSSDTQITVFAPAGTGTVGVTVTAPGGTSSSVNYRYAPIPAITQLSPDSGPATGGTTTTATGSGFTGATDLTIDGAAVAFSVLNNTTITFTTPAHNAGNTSVVVTTPGGTSTPAQFRYVNAPVVTSLSPDAGPLGGGTVVTLQGTDFTAASTVTFGGTAAASVQYVNSTELRVESPAKASAGAVSVVVSTPYGSSSGNAFAYTNAPTVSMVSPTAGSLNGGTAVIISGTGLTGATSVTFGGIAATSYTVNNDATITAVSPAGAVGNAVVRVTTVAGADTGTFRYAAAPAAGATSPTEGPEAGGTLVTISGSGFTGATSVTFGSASATGITVSSDTQITAFAPPGTGTVNVVVTAPGGTSPAISYRYAPVPTITQLTPDSGVVTGATSVTLIGTGLSGATDVTIGGAPASFTVVDGSTITLTTPPGTAGTAPVVVTTAGGSSAPFQFRYANAPTVTDLTPAAGPLAGGTSVTITGSDFTGASSVRFGPIAASFTVVNSTEITATSPAGSGSVDVTVTTPGGTSATSPADRYRYAPVPTSTQLAPTSGPLSGGTVVTLTGNGFSGASDVTVAGVSVSFTVQDDATITFTTLAGTIGDKDVVVTTPGGSSAPVSFRYVNAPVVTGLSPDAGPEAGGTAVTITGTGFTGTSDVRFGITAAPFTVVSSTQITTTTPAGTGTVDVFVTAPGGTTSTGKFRYAPLPTVANLTPAAGPLSGGTVVTLQGNGFTGAGTVTIGGVSVPFTATETTITFTTPAGSAGSESITVSAPGGTASVNFTYRSVPVIGSLLPNSGPLGGGTLVTLQGSEFTGTSSVTIGGVSVPFTVANDSTVTFTTPAGSAGSEPVTITTPGGVASTSFAYVNAPTVTDLTPAAGPLAGGTSVTITGTDFTLVSTVAFGADPATTVQWVSPTELIAVSPSSSAMTTVDVVVTTAYGNSATTGTDNDFTYTDAPVITGIQPNSGPIAGGNMITISGLDFTGATSVLFGTVAAISFSVSSATEITAVAPAHAAGMVDVRIASSGGTSPITVGDRYTFLSAPTLSSLAPDAGPTAGGTNVTITGTDFTPNSTVTFDGVSAGPVQWLSANQLTVPSPAHPAGAVDVVVTTPGGSSPVALTFDYQTAPSASGLTPSTGPLGGGTGVTITGTNFTPSSTVSFGGTAASSVTFVSVNRIDAVSPAASLAGPVDVVVTTAGGDSAPRAFTYLNRPVVTVVQPGSGPLAGNTTVTVTGSGFTGATAVSFGADPAVSFTVDSDTQITAVSPGVGAPATVDLTVVTAGGTSLTSIADRFTYRSSPQISGLAPNSGPFGGGTVVTVSGSGFTGATGVTVGGTLVPFVVVNDSTITFTAPAGAIGLEQVAVVTSGGSASTGFEYLNIPTIGSISPASGPVAGGTTVTLSGSGFTGATALRFGSLPATTWTVSNDSTITAVVPGAGSAGPVNVTVTGPVAISAAASYTYIARPVVSGVAPVSGPVTGGTAVTIRGSGFTGAPVVTFDGTSATNVIVQDGQTITATTPAHSAGAAAVVVTTVGGASAPGTFTFVPVPLMVALSPDAGPTSGGTEVTINGSGLTGGMVTVDGIGVIPESLTDSTILIRTPAHAAGTVAIIVTTPGGSANGQFTYVPPRAGPVLASVEPASGPIAGGETVRLTGVGFTGATQVRFGDAEATFTVVDDVTITAVVPAGSEGAVQVFVTTSDGTTEQEVSYIYVAPAVAPTISGVTPEIGPVAGGTRMTITGTGFDDETTVSFDGVPGTEVELGAAARLQRPPSGIRAAASTTLTVLTPPHPEGPAEVKVTNTAGSGTAETGFTFIPVLENASIDVRVTVNTATAVAPQGSLYAGLRVQACTTPAEGTTAVGTNAAFCRYTAPGQVGLDSFTMQVTDALGQQASQAVRVTVVDEGQEGEGTGGGGGNNNGGDGDNGGEGTGTGGDGDNDSGGPGDPDNGNDQGTGGSGGNNQGGNNQGGNNQGGNNQGGNNQGGNTPTPSVAPTPVATATPSAEPTTPSSVPGTQADENAAGDGDVHSFWPALLGIGALFILLLVLSVWYLWWPWLLALLRRRKKKDEGDQSEPGRSK